MSVSQWYRDPVSCLHSTLATLLLHRGEDPLSALGLGWEFRYLPGDVRSEEYYWPCRFLDDLARSVLPHHDVWSRWRLAPAADPLADLVESLAAGRLPILAVDNYHLPFRPAYHDVHAAHLLVVYAVDRARGTVSVADAMPPAYCGEIALDALMASWWSANPPDEQDAFFTGAATPARWLDVRVGTPFPELDAQRLLAALRANLAGFHDGTGSTGEADAATGLAGLRHYLALVARQAEHSVADTLTEAYTFGWSMQAQSAVHGELLRRCGRDWAVPELVEAGRRVEAVAHRWTGVRVGAAHGRTAPAPAAADLLRHGHQLYRCHVDALDALEAAVAALCGSPQLDRA